MFDFVTLGARHFINQDVVPAATAAAAAVVQTKESILKWLAPAGNRYYIVSRYQARIWITVSLVPLLLIGLWVHGLVARDRQRSEDSFILNQLREDAEKNHALQLAIEKVDRDYRQMLEDERDSMQQE